MQRLQRRGGVLLILVATVPAVSEGLRAPQPMCTRIASDGRLPAGASFTAAPPALKPPRGMGRLGNTPLRGTTAQRAPGDSAM